MRQQALRFALLSGLSFVVNLSTTYLLHEWVGWSSLVAVPIAMAIVTVMNFCVLRGFVFSGDGRGWWAQFAYFVLSIAGFRVAEYAAFVLLHGVLSSPYLITYAGILAASLVCKFLFLRGTVFRIRVADRPEPCHAN